MIKLPGNGARAPDEIKTTNQRLITITFCADCFTVKLLANICSVAQAASIVQKWFCRSQSEVCKQMEFEPRESTFDSSTISGGRTLYVVSLWYYMERLDHSLGYRKLVS